MSAPDSSGAPGRTITIRKTRLGSGGRVMGSFLFRGVACDEPLSRGTRVALDGVDLVALGRGSRFEFEIKTVSGARTADLKIPDARMSKAHAMLTRTLGAWVIGDQESKNGTYINGVRCDRHQLQDRDVIELGRSFFVFRDSIEIPEPVADCTDGDELIRRGLLASLLPSLASDFSDLEVLAQSAQPILVLGDTGTGKELAARAVHARSGRKGDFVALNCGALPKTLVESELFGNVKGAYSGADRERKGLIRSAQGGTLFLDEIGDLPASAQVALLRAIQEREVLPVGATRPISVDFRVVSATHRDLDHLVAQGSFREDLIARLDGFRLRLPPLRHRREDLPLVLGALLAKNELEAGSISLSPEVVRFLYEYQWPRNIRELEQSLGAALARCSDGEIEWHHFARDKRDIRPAHHSNAASAALSDEDRQRHAQLLGLLADHDGNISAIAREMGKARMQIQRWLKRYGLDASDFRKS